MQLKNKENTANYEHNLSINEQKIVLYTENSEKILKEIEGDLIDLFDENQTDQVIDNNLIQHYRKTIRQLLKNDFKICFTVPRKYLSNLLKNGLTPNADNTFDKQNILAGTIGRKPYLPSSENEDRYIVILQDPESVNLYNINPRLTGPDHCFHGVVSTNQNIPLKELTIIDSKDYKLIYPQKDNLVQNIAIENIRSQISNIIPLKRL